MIRMRYKDTDRTVLDPVTKVRDLYNQNGFKISLFKYYSPIDKKEYSITVSGGEQEFNNGQKLILRYNPQQSAKYHNYTFKLISNEQSSGIDITNIYDINDTFTRIFLNLMGFTNKSVDIILKNNSLTCLMNAIENDNQQEFINLAIKLPGIAELTANKIYERFHKQIIINNEIDETIKEYHRQMFIQELANQNMSNYQFTKSQINKIFDFYDTKNPKVIVSKLKDNFYDLLNVPGFGVNTVDSIYLSDSNHTKFDKTRIRGLTLFIMKQHLLMHNQSFIHYTTLTKKIIIASDLDFSKETRSKIISVIMKMSKDKDKIRMFKDSNDGLYRIAFLKDLVIENNILKLTNSLLADDSHFKIPDKDFDLEIKETENEMSKEVSNFKFNDMQLKAIKNVINKRLSVINGFAGTGKTTIMKAVLKILHDNHIMTCQCAFTGRAADGLQRVTGYPAHTVHSLLGLVNDDDENELHENLYHLSQKGKSISRIERCYYKIRNMIPANTKGITFIIDEYSTLDLNLFAVLEYCALRLNANIILIGDSGQLPAIHISTDELINVHNGIQKNKYNLTEIERQDDNSDIYTESLDVRSGKIPKRFKELLYGKIECQDNSDIHYHITDYPDLDKEIIKLFFNDLKKYHRLNDISILTPLNSLNHKLNNEIHDELLNKGYLTGDYAIINSQKIYEGELIVNTKNQYDKIASTGKSDKQFSIYNGNVGIVNKIISTGKDPSKDRIILIDFFNGQKTGKFDLSKKIDQSIISAFDLAYAMTVHKAQGSTIKAVIAIIKSQNGFNQFTDTLYSRQMLYTAMTRASDNLDLFIDYDTMKHVVETDVHKQYRTNFFSLLNPDSVNSIK